MKTQTLSTCDQRRFRDDFEAGSYKRLSLLGNIYKKSLQQYEIERRNFGEKLKVAMLEEAFLYNTSNTETHDLKNLGRKISLNRCQQQPLPHKQVITRHHIINKQ